MYNIRSSLTSEVGRVRQRHEHLLNLKPAQSRFPIEIITSCRRSDLSLGVGTFKAVALVDSRQDQHLRVIVANGKTVASKAKVAGSNPERPAIASPRNPMRVQVGSKPHL
jgi:hypothetical protein